MKSYLSILLLACACTMAAQETAVLDSTDVFFRHIELKQVVVTGPTGAVKMDARHQHCRCRGQAARRVTGEHRQRHLQARHPRIGI